MLIGHPQGLSVIMRDLLEDRKYQLNSEGRSLLPHIRPHPGSDLEAPGLASVSFGSWNAHFFPVCEGRCLPTCCMNGKAWCDVGQLGLFSQKQRVPNLVRIGTHPEGLLEKTKQSLRIRNHRVGPRSLHSVTISFIYRQQCVH